MRYCPSCHAPLRGSDAQKKHLESVQKIASTHRPDPTLVFLPEIREARRLQRKRRKRLAIAGAVGLALVAVLALGLYQRNRQQQVTRRVMARQQAAVRELRLLAAGLERFRDDMGRYPTDKEGIASLTNRAKVSREGGPEDAYSWQGPYVEGEYQLDPWGNDYRYQVADDGHAFELFSDGPDGAGGGEQLHISSPPRPEQ